MKLISKHSWNKRLPTSMATIIEIELEGSREAGQVEAAAQTADNCARFLGELTERLFDKGVLTRDDLTALLPHWEPAE